ncbi:MAG TPA: MFS transporter [Cyclobacteriaceae bacterium]|nr:MFS transporter [Cyclobacteriaceae bacterium]HRK53310.1 MFS transporter [Cyclobacteriaceae bacterium]
MDATALPQLNNTRIVRAWCMYDWANSVYSLVITSAIFPIYYKAVAVTENGDQVQFLGFSVNNSVLYTYSLSLAFLIVAIILPLLSGMADYAGKKKTYMKIFVGIGSLACIGLYFFRDVSDLEWGIFCSMLACIGYSGSLVFYDAFLPEIVTIDRYDETSARGYSMGYYGSVILMVICLFIITYFNSFGFSTEGDAVRFTFLLVGIWWIGFSMITFHYVPENPYGRKATGNIWTKGYAELVKVWGSLQASPNLKKYLTAFFFFNMGVQTVMYLATLFGTDVLQLDSTKLIMTILLIQMVAAVGAWLSARFSARYGNKVALLALIGVWITVCISAYFVATEYQFYALAFVVGLIMGGVQALARATYTKLIPETTIDHASYFSFFDVTFNLSIVFGTFSFGLINQLTGSMRNSALVLALFFVIGILMLSLVKSEKLKRVSSAGA